MSLNAKTAALKSFSLKKIHSKIFANIGVLRIETAPGL